MKVNFQREGEQLETAVTIVEVYQILTQIQELLSDDTELPAEVVDVLKTFGDGENGNNDIEKTLVDIRDSLMYDEENTAIYELSSRLEVIDTRLDLEFECLNYGIGVIGSVLLAYTSMKFLSWIFRFISF